MLAYEQHYKPERSIMSAVTLQAQLKGASSGVSL